MLIYNDDLLIAVMVQLEDEAHGVDDIGKWNLEATFDGLPFPVTEVFENLDHAKAWIAPRLDNHRRLRPERVACGRAPAARIGAMAAESQPSSTTASGRSNRRSQTARRRRHGADYFFGFGGAAPGIFWLGADAFALGGAAFFDLPLLSFMTFSSADPNGDPLR